MACETKEYSEFEMYSGNRIQMTPDGAKRISLECIDNVMLLELIIDSGWIINLDGWRRSLDEWNGEFVRDWSIHCGSALLLPLLEIVNGQ